MIALWRLAAPLVALAVLATGCGSDAKATAETLESVTVSGIEGDPLEAALERIPFGSSAVADPEAFPAEVLLAHLDCVLDATDGDAPALGEIVRVEGEPVTMELETIYADCALDSGVGEYAVVFTPRTLEEDIEITDAILRKWLDCLGESGYEDVPTFTEQDGLTWIDFDALYAQDPNAQQVARACDETLNE